MASRSATVLVIFIIAIVAFCLASVFGAMTGTISVIPNETDASGGILDNLSAITEGTGDTGNSYGNQNYKDYSSSNDDSSSDVETTVDDSSKDTSSSGSGSGGSGSGSSSGGSGSGGSGSGSSSGGSGSGESSDIETTVAE